MNTAITYRLGSKAIACKWLIVLTLALFSQSTMTAQQTNITRQPQVRTRGGTGTVTYPPTHPPIQEPIPKNDFEQGKYLLQQNKVQPAFEKFKRAAENNVVEAQLQLGIMYESGTGIGTGRDMFNAIKWYKEASKSGNEKARDKVKRIEQESEKSYARAKQYYIDEDYRRAFIWFKDAAEYGLSAAQNMLGYCYETGTGISTDLQKARYWYQKGAELGNADASEALQRLDNGSPDDTTPTTVTAPQEL